MENGWFIFSGEKTWGPYSLNDIKEMLSRGEINWHTPIFSRNFAIWKPAHSIPELNSGNLPGESQPAPQKNVKRKMNGCLVALIAVITSFALVFTGIFAFISYINRPVTLGRSNSIIRESVNSEGSIIETEEIIIEVPEDAFESNTTFRISSREIKDHKLGEHFNPVSDLITIRTGGDWSEVPMTVTIPIDISENEFAMAFYYRSDGTLEPLPLIYSDRQNIVFATRHFSDIVATKINKEILYNINIDTGFRPGIDDFPFANYGSQISWGHCAGQAAAMVYYYTNLREKNRQPLSGRYDNNTHVIKTPDFNWDDSLGIRLSSVVQEEIDWGGSYWNYLREKIHRKKYIDDNLMYLAFAYAMLITEQPQLMGIFVRDAVPEEEIRLSAGHAIVIYKIENMVMHVTDPNFPGRKDLRIPFDGNTLGPYISRTTADAPDRVYNSYSLIGKTALFDWHSIGDLYKEMYKPSQISEIGAEKFGESKYSVLIDFNDNIEETASNPQVVIYEQDQKDRIREYLSEDDNIPEDWDTKDYMIVDFSVGAKGSGLLVAYSGTEETVYEHAAGSDSARIFIPLDPGLNDIGLGFFDLTPHEDYYIENFVHFHRVAVQNGEEDLSGTWEGTFQIKNFDRLTDYVERIAFFIVKPIVRILTSAFDTDMPSDQEIRQAISDSIEVNEEALKPYPLRIDLEKQDSENYSAKILFQGDVPEEYATTASFRDRKLTFTVDFAEGGQGEFEYYLYDNNTLSGDFSFHYGVMNAVTGETSAIRIR